MHGQVLDFGYAILFYTSLKVYYTFICFSLRVNKRNNKNSNNNNSNNNNYYIASLNMNKQNALL
jgi:ABC-type transport system involved in multi-copper enzyme maturation permease subunit